MRLYDIGSILVIMAIIVAGVGVASKYFYGPDNAVEEACEDILEAATGANIDLSPEDVKVENEGNDAKEPEEAVDEAKKGKGNTSKASSDQKQKTKPR